MRETTKIILQLHQILRVPCKMNLMIDPHHIWNVIYNARSNKSHPPTSPNTAPATQNEYHDWSASHMKRHLQRAEKQESSSNFTKYCACHAKRISWLIRVTYETSVTMRGATGMTLQPHQLLRLPRKMNLMMDSDHIWNVIYNARSKSQHPPTSPNTAPAMQNECHMMDPHPIWNVIYNARSNSQHPPTSPNTAPATQNDSPTSDRNLMKTAETSFTMRDRSENDPSMIREWSDHKLAHRNPPRHRGYFSHSPGADSIENYNVSRSGYHSKFHQMLRLPRKVTHELHQMLRLPRKMNLMMDSDHIMKRYLQCAEQKSTPSNLTKYCACHAKWMSWWIHIPYETLFTMRGATVNTLQPHQILRLPRKMTAQHLTEIWWKQLKRHFQCATDPTMIRAWSEHDPRMIRP